MVSRAESAAAESVIEWSCQGGIHLLAPDEAGCSIKTLTRTDCLCCTALHCIVLHCTAHCFNRLCCRVGWGGEEQLGSEPGQQENEHERAYFVLQVYMRL